MNRRRLTAKEASLVSCHLCGKLFRDTPAPKRVKRRCTRCGATLHSRKPESLARTWALVITGLILYIPANLYPIMTVTQMGRGTPDTILSGIVALFNSGLWSIGVIVFTGLTAYDIQKISRFGGSVMSEGNAAIRKGAIMGALSLYLDFINLFLSLLRLLGDRR